MKAILLFAVLLGIVVRLSGQTNVYGSNNVTRAVAIQAASHLRAGMWEESVTKQIATNGLNNAISAGAVVGWNSYYRLSDGSSLVLDYTARSIATNGNWGGNGLLRKAWIESNSVTLAQITFTNKP